MGKKAHGSGPKGLPLVLTLAALGALAVAFVSGALPVDMGRWLGLPAGSEDAAERVFTLDVRDGKLPEDLRLLRVTQGDLVTLKWTADRPMTLHLHGYDVERQAGPGSPAEFAFTAYAAGRFPIEAHPPGREPAADQPALTYLEVYPR